MVVLVAFRGKRERVTSLDAMPRCGSPLGKGELLTKSGLIPDQDNQDLGEI